MVKSYQRFEQEKCFGVISSQSNIIWLPSDSSSGRAITSGLEEILIWDIKSGEIISRLSDGITPGASNALTSQAPPSISYMSHHQETNILAVGYVDGSIKIWDLTSKSVIINFQGHKSSISILKFDKSGTRLCSGSSDSSVILWDLIGEEGLFKLKGHKSQITGMSFLSEDPESKSIDDLEDYLLTVSKDGLIKIWELKTQQCIETHVAHSQECWSMGIHNNLCITSGNKDQVKIWNIDLSRPDTEKIQERGVFEKQSKARCNEILFNFGSSSVMECFYLQNADRTIELFRIRSEDEIKKGILKRTKRLREKGYDDDEILESIKESEVSMMITPLTVLRTTAKIRACTWVGGNSNTNNRHNKKKGSKFDIIVSLNTNSIEYHNIPIPATADISEIKKLSPTDLTSVKKHSIDLLGHRTDIRAMDLSSDNKLLATASNGELKIWNIKTTNVLRTLSTEGGYALCCKFLPGGTLVVVGFKNGDLELYDLSTSSLVDKVNRAHGSDDDECAVWSLDLTSDGKTLVTGGNDKCVKFWNFQVEQELVPGTASTMISKLKITPTQSLELDEEILCVKLSSDNKYLAISLLNNNVQVIFLDSLKLFLTLYGHKLPVLSIDISDDNKLIITSSADKNIKIWGLDFGDCHKSIFAHQDSIMNVKFIPETHNFFSSGKDGLIKYWDGDKFECIQKLPAHKLEVWCLCVSRDGRFMVSTSHDHSIRLWEETDDQVFLEEEREKEMDEQYENTLLDSLEGEQEVKRNGESDDEDGEGDDNNEVTNVSKQTSETLKAGERLMEAIDIGIIDVLESEDFEKHLKQYKAKLTTVQPVKPNKHTILMAFNMDGQEYVLSVLSKIKPSQLEDALLVFPFSYSLKLFKFIEIWTNKSNITNNVTNLSMICKVLYFIVRSNANELINQKDADIKNQLVLVKQQLRDQLESTSTQLGFNIHGLRFIKQQWKLTHESAFIDEEEQREYEDLKAKKRVYTTM